MKLNIAVLPGDGIGPEVTEQAIKVLKAIAMEFDHYFNFNYASVGAIFGFFVGGIYISLYEKKRE